MAPVLVGRAAERERIDDLLADARAGRSGALLLVGDPGVGKTALLDAALQEVAGLRVLRTTGFELETDLAFASLGALLRPLADGKLRARDRAQLVVLASESDLVRPGWRA
jgi:predicted ATPase